MLFQLFIVEQNLVTAALHQVVYLSNASTRVFYKLRLPWYLHDRSFSSCWYSYDVNKSSQGCPSCLGSWSNLLSISADVPMSNPWQVTLAFLKIPFLSFVSLIYKHESRGKWLVSSLCLVAHRIQVNLHRLQLLFLKKLWCSHELHFLWKGNFLFTSILFKSCRKKVILS